MPLLTTSVYFIQNQNQQQHRHELSLEQARAATESLGFFAAGRYLIDAMELWEAVRIIPTEDGVGIWGDWPDQIVDMMIRLGRMHVQTLG